MCLALMRVKIFEVFLAGKAAKDWGRRVVMVPGIGGRFGLLRVIEEKKPLWW